MPLADGAIVLVEVPDGDAIGIERVGRVGEVIRDASETLEQALSRIQPAAAAVLRGMRAMVTPPDKVTVEFGVKLTAEAGVVVAKAASEANFKVIVEWSASESTDTGD